MLVRRPLAGTRWRGRTEEEDLALEKDLLSDEKERAEHVMLVDLGRNDVGRVRRMRRPRAGRGPARAGLRGVYPKGSSRSAAITEDTQFELRVDVQHAGGAVYGLCTGPLTCLHLCAAGQFASACSSISIQTPTRS